MSLEISLIGCESEREEARLPRRRRGRGDYRDDDDDENKNRSALWTADIAVMNDERFGTDCTLLRWLYSEVHIPFYEAA